MMATAEEEVISNSFGSYPLTDAERSFLADIDVMFDRESPENVRSSLPGDAQQGGFTGEEIAHILGPIPTAMTEELQPLSSEWLPMDFKRKAPLHNVSFQLANHFPDLDASKVLSPIVIGSSTGTKVIVCDSRIVGAMYSDHRSEISSHSSRTLKEIIKLEELTHSRLVATHRDAVGLVSLEADLNVTVHNACWQVKPGDQIHASSTQTEGRNQIACASDLGNLIILDSTGLRAAAAREFAFGRDKARHISWCRSDLNLLGCSTDKSFSVFDTRCSFLSSSHHINVRARCHCFFGDFGVLVADRNGILNVVDVRSLTKPLLNFQDPLFGEITSLSCAKTGRLVQINQYTNCQTTGGVSIWDLDLHVDAKTSSAGGISHTRLVDFNDMQFDNPITASSWISSGEEMLVVVDNVGALSIFDMSTKSKMHTSH